MESNRARAGQAGRAGQASLVEECVACTGRLASMTRAEAAALIERLGGRFTPRVTRQTTLLVVGEAGWPLKSDGRLTRKLQTARGLRNAGSPIEIVREEQFLLRIGGADQRAGAGAAGSGAAAEICGTCSTFELIGLLKISRDRLRAWVRAGLIEPHTSEDGFDTFDFREVSRAKTLVDLAERGVSVRSLRRSLQQLRSWLPGAADSLEWLGRLRQEGRQLVVHAAHDAWIEPSGQRRLNFDVSETEEPASALISLPLGNVDLFELATQFEEAGDFRAACDAYRRLLEVEGPDPEVCFNLGNALYAIGEQAAAAERFRQAIELEPLFAEAWLNLGNVLCELDDHPGAVRAFERALVIDPQYADGHYSLADALEELGETTTAREHWRAYLEQEAYGEWADYARSRLASRA